jgi:hypothetical protein
VNGSSRDAAKDARVGFSWYVVRVGGGASLRAGGSLRGGGAGGSYREGLRWKLGRELTLVSSIVFYEKVRFV